MPAKRKHTPYWTRAIQRAKARMKRGNLDPFTREDRERAADSWVTCACGKQDARLWGDTDREPWDERLRQLGLLFGQQVDQQLPVAAGKTLALIEQRAARLLRSVPSDRR